MKLSLGIVGLPNVGKSTLFNALTQNDVPAENYPFNTIDPNVGIVQVRDVRLEKIAQICNPQQVVPAVVEFYDIAGLVKGAHEGQGLGNQFLSHIKEVSAIVHVVRAFQNKDVTHVEQTVDPARDIEIINTELILKDIATVEKRIEGIARQARSDKKLEPALTHLQELKDFLNDNNLALDHEYNKGDELIAQTRQELHLLTDKPVIYLVNVEPERAEEATKLVQGIVGDKQVVAMDIRLEGDLLQMDEADRKEFMDSYGMHETGLEQLTLASYALLNLISYFTAGEKEAKAWTIYRGSLGPQAAAAIHTDFEKKFIAAEVVTSEDYIELGGWEGAKAKGKLRLEGRDYEVKDGDVVLFRIGS